VRKEGSRPKRLYIGGDIQRHTSDDILTLEDAPIHIFKDLKRLTRIGFLSECSAGKEAAD